MRRNLAELPTFDGKSSSNLNVVIESPRGSGAKFDYNPDRDLFELSYVMPSGLAFPFDFGFVPSTLAEDGDPLDMIVLLDVPTCVGCFLVARPIGVIEASQTQDGKTFRNDRLIGVADAAHERAKLKSISELDSVILDDIEHFFISYNRAEGRDFRPTGRKGPEAAAQLVEAGMRRFAEGGSGQ